MLTDTRRLRLWALLELFSGGGDGSSDLVEVLSEDWEFLGSAVRAAGLERHFDELCAEEQVIFSRWVLEEGVIQKAKEFLKKASSGAKRRLAAAVAAGLLATAGGGHRAAPEGGSRKAHAAQQAQRGAEQERANRAEDPSSWNLYKPGGTPDRGTRAQVRQQVKEPSLRSVRDVAPNVKSSKRGSGLKRTVKAVLRGKPSEAW